MANSCNVFVCLCILLRWIYHFYPLVSHLALNLLFSMLSSLMTLLCDWAHLGSPGTYDVTAEVVVIRDLLGWRVARWLPLSSAALVERAEWMTLAAQLGLPLCPYSFRVFFAPWHLCTWSRHEVSLTRKADVLHPKVKKWNLPGLFNI